MILSGEWEKIEKSVSGETQTTTPVSPAAKDEQALDGHQKRTLRYYIAGAVVFLLFLELWGLFLLIIWQGRGHFKLNEWMFGFLTNGVLLQTFFSLRTIITHLFPDGKADFRIAGKSGDSSP